MCCAKTKIVKMNLKYHVTLKRVCTLLISITDDTCRGVFSTCCYRKYTGGYVFMHLAAVVLQGLLL